MLNYAYLRGTPRRNCIRRVVTGSHNGHADMNSSEFDVRGLGVLEKSAKTNINKAPPIEGLNDIRIPILIPFKGKGFVNPTVDESGVWVSATPQKKEGQHCRGLGFRVEFRALEIAKYPAIRALGTKNHSDY